MTVSMTFPSLSIAPSCFSSIPCSAAPQQEDLVVFSAEGGLLSPTMLSLSVSLSSPSSDLSAEKEMCVYLCIHAAPLLPLPSSLFLFSFFSRVTVFLPNICHLLFLPFPFSLSLSLSLPTHKTHTSGCYGIWLPCSTDVFTWPSRVYMSTVA